MLQEAAKAAARRDSFLTRGRPRKLERPERTEEDVEKSCVSLCLPDVSTLKINRVARPVVSKY